MWIPADLALASCAVALGAARTGRLSAAERAIAESASRFARHFPPAVDGIRARIQAGEDPLGDALCDARTPAQRRPIGATFTPPAIVRSMVGWASSRAGQVGVTGAPTRVVDPGTGSARFLLAAGRAFPRAELIGIETDPLIALLVRANLAAAGFAKRSRIERVDYRDFTLPAVSGSTLFIGNPPYVRHHDIGRERKAWFTAAATSLGLVASQRAGLHAHFFVATALLARPSDYGSFVTSAEWLDVNYGAALRELFAGRLGGESVHVIEPAARPFADAHTTAVISCFDVDTRATRVGVRRVSALDELGELQTARSVSRQRLESAPRWTPHTRPRPRKRDSRVARYSHYSSSDLIELGEICRVHRGQVTGLNRVWIAGPMAEGLPDSVLFPAVTRARELFASRACLATTDALRPVVDLPVELDSLNSLEDGARDRVERFLMWAKQEGAHETYIARHRRPWWRVGLREPPPIMASYMARRPPVFTRNAANARCINIAHGLYPREALSERTLRALVAFLNATTSTNDGRTYAGGLTKFEPKEMERLCVPRPELLGRHLSES